MKRSLSSLFAVALALTVVGCSDTKTSAKDASVGDAKASTADEKPAAVAGTKTVSLANGAKVTWI
jgi:hypothetical protein